MTLPTLPATTANVSVVVAGRVGKVVVLSLVVKSLSVIAGNEIDAGEFVGWQTEISVCR